MDICALNTVELIRKAAGIASAQEVTPELKSFEGAYQLIQGSAKVKGDFSKISQEPSTVCLPKFKLAQGEDYLELVDASNGQFVESFESDDKNTSLIPGVPASDPAPYSKTPA